MLPTILVSLSAFFIKSACGRLHLPEFGDTMQNISAIRGDDVKFTCQVRNIGRNMVAWIKVDSKGTTLISWQHKLFRAKYKYKIEVQQNELWILHVRDVQKEDAGGYSCQINTAPMQSQTAYLTLKVPPSIIREETTNDIVVKEGHNVSLYCAAEGSPSPSVSWRRKDGGLITLDTSDGYGVSVVHQSNLSIHKVSRNHMTDYICLATNNIPPDESWSVKLRVHFQPTVYAVRNVVYALIGSDAILDCKSEAWPQPEYIWEVEGSVITVDNRKYQMTVEESPLNEDSYETLGRLRIKNVHQEDFRDYTCNAKNDHGAQSATVALKPIERPPIEDNYIPTVKIDVDEENSDFNQVMNDKSQPIGKEQLLQSPSVTTERQKQPNFNNRRSPTNSSARHFNYATSVLLVWLTCWLVGRN